MPDNLTTQVTGREAPPAYNRLPCAHTTASILSTLEGRKEDIRRFSVRRLGLFGSVVRGEHTGSSDLDFLVEFDKKSFDSYMNLKHFLEKLFGCKVDLVLADTLKPRLREVILGETIYAAGL
ncbi:MAG TPA: nucleotidyltransferase family protein [Terriglobia bacterium]|nr:nucleotidyltransferase family protein [Terriglobia bacterium]